MQNPSLEAKTFVTLEIWQNQRHWPTKGWFVPVFSTSHFVAHFTDTTICSNDFPHVVLPENWEWVGEWTVDTTQSLGPADSEGWLYGPTFDEINRAINNPGGHLSSFSPSTSTCRRRRWLRIMQCTTPDIHNTIIQRVNHIGDRNKRLRSWITEKKSIVDELVKCENRRFQEEKTKYIAVLKPLHDLQQRFDKELQIVVSLKKMLFGLSKDKNNDFMSDVESYAKDIDSLLQDCEEEYEEANALCKDIYENIQYLLKNTQASLIGVIENCSDEILLNEEEVRFLNNGGVVGTFNSLLNPRETSRVVHMKKKMKSRKVSWDLAEYGDIWYAIKYYYRLVINLQEAVHEVSKRVAAVWAKQGQYADCLHNILKGVVDVYPTKYSTWESRLSPDLKDYLDTLQERSEQLASPAPLQFPPFHLDTENFPPLPPTLGKFNVMIAMATDIAAAFSTTCIPPNEVKGAYRDPDSDTAKFVTVEGVSWLEVIIVITTDGFLHILPAVGDYDFLVPIKSIPLKGSTVKIASTQIGFLESCVEIQPLTLPYSYLIYHRLLGRRIGRSENGIVVCLDGPEIAQVLIEVISNNFSTFGGSNGHPNQYDESMKFVHGHFDVESEVDMTFLGFKNEKNFHKTGLTERDLQRDTMKFYYDLLHRKKPSQLNVNGTGQEGKDYNGDDDFEDDDDEEDEAKKFSTDNPLTRKRNSMGSKEDSDKSLNSSHSTNISKSNSRTNSQSNSNKSAIESLKPQQDQASFDNGQNTHLSPNAEAISKLFEVEILREIIHNSRVFSSTSPRLKAELRTLAFDDKFVEENTLYSMLSDLWSSNKPGQLTEAEILRRIRSGTLSEKSPRSSNRNLTSLGSSRKLSTSSNSSTHSNHSSRKKYLERLKRLSIPRFKLSSRKFAEEEERPKPTSFLSENPLKTHSSVRQSSSRSSTLFKENPVNGIESNDSRDSIKPDSVSSSRSSLSRVAGIVDDGLAAAKQLKAVASGTTSSVISLGIAQSPSNDGKDDEEESEKGKKDQEPTIPTSRMIENPLSDFNKIKEKTKLMREMQLQIPAVSIATTSSASGTVTSVKQALI